MAKRDVVVAEANRKSRRSEAMPSVDLVASVSHDDSTDYSLGSERDDSRIGLELSVPLYAGDNGGRPRGFGRPRLLALAEQHGKYVLPGTDPLPLRGEDRKAGRFGFVAELDLDPKRPFDSLRRWLVTQTSSPTAYGRLEGLPVFLERQIALRARKFGARQ